jgi:hypothetical protein
MASLCRDTSTRPDSVDDRRPRRSKLNGLRSLGAVPLNENACCDGSQQALRCVTLKMAALT